MFVTITETLITKSWTILKHLLPEKRPLVRQRLCIAIKNLQRSLYSVQKLLSRMIYWIIKLVKSRYRTRFMPINEEWALRKIIIMWLSGSEPFLYLFSSKNAIFHKFLYRTFWYSRNYTYFYFPKWRYKPRMVLKITNLHILRYLPTYWLYLLERYTIDNQRCTHTASEINKYSHLLSIMEKRWEYKLCYGGSCDEIVGQQMAVRAIG